MEWSGMPIPEKPKFRQRAILCQESIRHFAAENKFPLAPKHQYMKHKRSPVEIDSRPRLFHQVSCKLVRIRHLDDNIYMEVVSGLDQAYRQVMDEAGR